MVMYYPPTFHQNSAIRRDGLHHNKRQSVSQVISECSEELGPSLGTRNISSPTTSVMAVRRIHISLAPVFPKECLGLSPRWSGINHFIRYLGTAFHRGSVPSPRMSRKPFRRSPGWAPPGSPDQPPAVGPAEAQTGQKPRSLHSSSLLDESSSNTALHGLAPLLRCSLTGILAIKTYLVLF